MLRESMAPKQTAGDIYRWKHHYSQLHQKIIGGNKQTSQLISSRQELWFEASPATKGWNKLITAKTRLLYFLGSKSGLEKTLAAA